MVPASNCRTYWGLDQGVLLPWHWRNFPSPKAKCWHLSDSGCAWCFVLDSLHPSCQVCLSEQMGSECRSCSAWVMAAEWLWWFLGCLGRDDCYKLFLIIFFPQTLIVPCRIGQNIVADGEDGRKTVSWIPKVADTKCWGQNPSGRESDLAVHGETARLNLGSLLLPVLWKKDLSGAEEEGLLAFPVWALLHLDCRWLDIAQVIKPNGQSSAVARIIFCFLLTQTACGKRAACRKCASSLLFEP